MRHKIGQNHFCLRVKLVDVVVEGRIRLNYRNDKYAGAMHQRYWEYETMASKHQRRRLDDPRKRVAHTYNY
jgi:hypothetical protein